LFRSEAARAGRSSAFHPARKAASLALPFAVLPWLAGKVLEHSIREPMVEAPGGGGIWVVGLLTLGIAAWQLTSKSEAVITLRKWLLIALMVGTAMLSGGYVHMGLRAYADAVVGPPARAFETMERCGRRCWKPVYQRADGELIGERESRPLREHAPSCVLAQDLVGRAGFRWMRVLERSRQPDSGQLAWPVRREECFSEIPLSALPR
jgi:hypothetical protein